MTQPEGLPPKVTCWICKGHGQVYFGIYPRPCPECSKPFLTLPEEDAKTEGIDLRRMTDEWICDGNVSPQAVIDLRESLSAARAEVEELREENRRLREWQEWHRGPANGGGGTAQDRCPEGHYHWWWDGDQLEVIFDLVSGPAVMLVTISADGDQASMTVSGTDEDPGYELGDIAWWRKIGPLPAAPESKGGVKP